MKRWLEMWGYHLCRRPGWLADRWAPVWYRHYCPYPIIEDFSAHACIMAGKCGCSNLAKTQDWVEHENAR